MDFSVHQGVHPDAFTGAERCQQAVGLPARELKAEADPVALLRARPQAVVPHHVGMLGPVVRRRVDEHTERAPPEDRQPVHPRGVARGQNDLAFYVFPLVVGGPSAPPHVRELAPPVPAV